MRPIALLMLAACGSAASEGAPSAGSSEPAEPAKPPRVELSERVAHDAGVQSAAVELASLPATVELTGEVAADPDRVAKVAARIAGRLVELRFHEGQQVRAGDVLAVLESSEVARVRAELLSSRTRADAARQRVERVAKLVDAGTASAQDLETARAEASVADAEASAARQTAASVGEGGAARLELRAPISGIAVQRDGVIGQPVAADHVVAEIADLDHAELVARLFEHDLARTQEGAHAEIRLDAYPEVVLRGTVRSIGRRVDPIARAVHARIAIDAPDTRLKLGLFGTALVILPDPRDTRLPIVPTTAVTQLDGRATVFVELSPRVFEPRPVETGHAVAGKIEITRGLTGSERVATAGLFTLKSLALKTSFGEED